MFLITVKNLNIILVVYLVKKLIINNVAYTSYGGGVYVLWGWRIHQMGVAYTSNGPIRPKGRFTFIHYRHETLKLSIKWPSLSSNVEFFVFYDIMVLMHFFMWNHSQNVHIPKISAFYVTSLIKKGTTNHSNLMKQTNPLNTTVWKTWTLRAFLLGLQAQLLPSLSVSIFCKFIFQAVLFRGLLELMILLARNQD